MPSVGKQEQPRPPALSGLPVRWGSRQGSSDHPHRSNGKLSEIQGFEEEMCGANGANRGLTWSAWSGIFFEKDQKDG